MDKPLYSSNCTSRMDTDTEEITKLQGLYDQEIKDHCSSEQEEASGIPLDLWVIVGEFA